MSTVYNSVRVNEKAWSEVLKRERLWWTDLDGLSLWNYCSWSNSLLETKLKTKTTNKPKQTSNHPKNNQKDSGMLFALIFQKSTTFEDFFCLQWSIWFHTKLKRASHPAYPEHRFNACTQDLLWGTCLPSPRTVELFEG